MRCIDSTRRSRTRSCRTSEAGNIILIGATTENPSFEVIAPLLSRTRVYVLQALSTEQIEVLLRRALRIRSAARQRSDRDERGGDPTHRCIFRRRCAGRVQHARSRYAGGAAGFERQAVDYPRAACRIAATQIFALRQIRGRTLQPDFGAAQVGAEFRPGRFAVLAGANARVRGRPAVHRAQAGAYGQRGYRTAEPGHWPSPSAAMQAADFVGPPEGNLALAQAAVYLSLAPKSNAVYTGMGR